MSRRKSGRNHRAPATFMHVVCVVELLVGVAVIGAFTRVGAWVAAGWLALIVLNLVASGHLVRREILEDLVRQSPKTERIMARR